MEEAISKPFEISVVDFQGASQSDNLNEMQYKANTSACNNKTERQYAITSDTSSKMNLPSSKAHAYYSNSHQKVQSGNKYYQSSKTQQNHPPQFAPSRNMSENGDGKNHINTDSISSAKMRKLDFDIADSTAYTTETV